MSDTSEEEALQVTPKIRQAVEQLHIKHDKSKVSDHVTMSMGIYTSNDNMSSREVLLKTDKTLYEAKKTRNTIQQYSNI